MELDHIFVFCKPDSGYGQWLKSFGLVETYRRQHPGQGTENICFCFENAFIELLWVNDESETRSPLIARTGLYERSRHRDLGTCPFGIAWRGSGQIPTWPYHPPYMPPQVAIDVATDGDDPTQPMMFRSPGDSAPRSWPAERRGNLQRDAGFQSVRLQQLAIPSNKSPSPALQTLASDVGFDLCNGGSSYRMDLRLDRRMGEAPITLSLHDGIEHGDPFGDDRRVE